MIEHIENPQAITTLFGDGFDFAQVDLHEVTLHRDGPRIRLRFDIAGVPACAPARWPSDANTTQVVLSATVRGPLQISGFGTECAGLLRVVAEADRKVLEFASAEVSIRCVCAWLRIDRISAYASAIG